VFKVTFVKSGILQSCRKLREHSATVVEQNAKVRNLRKRLLEASGSLNAPSATLGE
jgi:hypothetical protein